MAFRKFFLKIIAYILIICIIGAITIWSFHQEELAASRFILLGIWGFLTSLLIRTILQSLKPMEKFLNSLQSDDLINIPARKQYLSREINEAYRTIHEILQNIKTDKEEQYHLFQNSINHVSSGILVFNEEGYIRLKNKSTDHIFDSKPFSNVNRLGKFDKELPGFLMDTSQRRGLYKFKTHSGLQKLSIRLQDFILKGEKLRIASLQNISEELEKEELLAWKKLLHVITHEIMNSVTPLKTLSYSLHNSFSENNQAIKTEQLNNVQLKDLHEGLNAMNTRISGLMNFVESYRKLYKIPEPKIRETSVDSILSEIKILFDRDMEEKGIQFTIKGETDISILADKEMITQVLINLIKNAMDAMNEGGNPSIQIEVGKNEHESQIKVIDNGRGMNEDEMQNCFVPFYTTKENGSGIGLYYSRLIALLHKGNITTQEPENGHGTVFVLTL